MKSRESKPHQKCLLTTIHFYRSQSDQLCFSCAAAELLAKTNLPAALQSPLCCCRALGQKDRWLTFRIANSVVLVPSLFLRGNEGKRLQTIKHLFQLNNPKIHFSGNCEVLYTHIWPFLVFKGEWRPSSHLVQKQKGKKMPTINTRTLAAMQMSSMQCKFGQDWFAWTQKKVKRKWLSDGQNLYILTTHLLSARATTAQVLVTRSLSLEQGKGKAHLTLALVVCVQIKRTVEVFYRDKYWKLF